MNDYKKRVCELIKTSSNFKEVADKLNISVGGNTYKEFEKIALECGVSTNHFTKNYKPINDKSPLTPETIFVENSNRNSSFISRYIKKFSLKELRCECCKNTEWMGKPISLQIHHINGDTTDNRLENLQYLCPNCHSFTDNYCGKNTKKKKEKDNIEYKKQLKKQQEIEDKINLIHSSGVDFSKWGWVSKIAKLCKTNTTKVKQFMEKYDNDFYKTCYNKEKATIKVSKEKDDLLNKKENRLQDIEYRKKQIIESGITQHTYGWQTKLAKILNIKRQSLIPFINLHMPEFYNL